VNTHHITQAAKPGRTLQTYKGLHSYSCKHRNNCLQPELPTERDWQQVTASNAPPVNVT